MNVRPIRFILRYMGPVISLVLCTFLNAQELPRFTDIQRLTNQEVSLKLSAPTGQNFRIEVSSNFAQWAGWMAVRTAATGLSQQTDSAAPLLFSRFFRAVQSTETNALTGDILPTDDGDVVIHPINHA